MPALYRQQPFDEIDKMPFGPLLARWMDKGVGLPQDTKSSRWSRKGLVHALDRDGAAGVSESSVGHWRNGIAIPRTNNWTALKEALTKGIDPKVKEHWLAALVASWDRCKDWSEDDRKVNYAAYQKATQSWSPVLEALNARTEDEPLWVENQAAARLHNTAPQLLEISRSAAEARAAGRTDEAIGILERGFLEHADELALRNEAQGMLAMQLASYRPSLDRNQQRANDYQSALKYLPAGPARDQAKVAFWHTVARAMIEIDEYDPALLYFETQLEAVDNSSVLVWSVLLALADSFAQGEAVLTRMTDKGLTPNVVTWNTFVSKFFAEKTGPELLEWAWGARAKFGTGFGYLAFGPAITGYRKLRRFEDALWIIASYANLPASEAFFRSTARAKLAEAFFCARLAEGYKPKDVSFALAKLNQVIGNRAKTVLWAEKALALPDQHPKRRAELERMLAGTR